MYPVEHRCSDCIDLMLPAFNIKGYSDKTLSFVMFGAASLWGLYWLPVRALAEMGIDGVWPVALMNLFPALYLTPFMLTLLIRPDSGVREAFWSGLSVGIGFAFYTFAMLETTIVRATLLFYLTPIWSTLLGIFILSEPFTRTRAIAISVGLLGCFILLSPDQTASVALNIGDLYGLLAGGFWAIGATCIKRWPQSPALLITWFQLISTTLVALIFCSVNISNAGAGLATCRSKSSNYVRGVGFYSFALNATADDHISGALSGQSGGFDDVRSFGGNRQRIATRTGGKDELGAVGGRCGDYHCGSF